MLESLSQHDRVQRTLAYFEDGQDFYVVQQYIAGSSLEEVLAQSRRLSELELRRLLNDILEVLEFVQARGVIHRNVKPSNIIRRQQDNRWILVDFGLVKEVNARMADTSNGAETAHNDGTAYTAPEQRQGVPHFGTDVFALGLVALQAATGCQPQNLPHSGQQDYEQEVQTCLAAVPDLSHRLQHVLQRMVHPDPDKRYQKARDVRIDLGLNSVAEAPAVVTPPAAPAAAGRPASQRRLPLVWMLMAAGLVIVAVATILGLQVPQKLMVARWLSQADQAEMSGETDAAIATYNRILDLNPNQVEALSQRSDLYRQQGATDQALRDLTNALEVSAQNDELYYQRGNLRFQVGDLQGAIADYTEAIRLDSGFVDAYINRGSARAEWGDEQGAIADYTAAIELEPGPEKQSAAYLNRCLSRSNRGRHQAALEDCSQAINLRPDDSLAYENRGLVRRRLGDFDGAIKDYTIAIEIAPNSPDPYYNRGLARQDLGDTAGALEDFNQALKLDPDHLFARYDRGLLAAEQDRISAAITDLEIAASRCLELGRLSCYEDAQFHLNALKPSSSP